MMRVTAVLLTIITFGGPVLAEPRADFEGVWATTNSECADEEGPNTRTLIDMSNKVGPLYDSYEHHCRILGVSGPGNARTLSLSCHEFWEEFTKKTSPQRETVKLQMKGPQSLIIDGKPYVRCLR